jgi:hypothetical protein
MKNPTAEIGTAHTASLNMKDPTAKIGTAHTANDKAAPSASNVTAITQQV